MKHYVKTIQIVVKFYIELKKLILKADVSLYLSPVKEDYKNCCLS
jgi:hypothetical protein